MVFGVGYSRLQRLYHITNYDSMIAKIITTDQKEEAINKMRRALDEFVIEGIKTTIPFHRKLMDNEDYLKRCVYNKIHGGF